MTSNNHKKKTEFSVSLGLFLVIVAFLVSGSAATRMVYADTSSGSNNNPSPSGGSPPPSNPDVSSGGTTPSPPPPPGTLSNPTTTTTTPPGPPVITPPSPAIVTPPIVTAPLVGPITCKPTEVLQDGKCIPKPICKPTEVLQDGKCVPQPPIYCLKGVAHQVGDHCELNKNCHYDKDRNGNLTGDITCVIIVRGHTEETHSSRGSSNYVGGSSSFELTQIPSKATDFPGNDQSKIQVHITSAKKDIIGSYHVMGELTNNGNSTIHNVMVTAHFYDANNGLVGVSTCCYTTPISIEPGHTATFDSFVQKSDYSGTPVSFRLSYDWS
jgi:hypothetical protein